MNRRDKWILIVVIIGGGACGIATVAYLGSFAIWAMRDLNRMEARRPVLLYQTDHQALLEACRELSAEAAAGKIRFGAYNRGDPEMRQFPQLIQNLTPVQVEITGDGDVDILMSAVILYGVRVLPENYEHPVDKLFKYDDGVWAIELLDGLWYYDENFQRHPEHKKEVEELLKNRK